MSQYIPTIKIKYNIGCFFFHFVFVFCSIPLIFSLFFFFSYLRTPGEFYKIDIDFISRWTKERKKIINTTYNKNLNVNIPKILIRFEYSYKKKKEKKKKNTEKKKKKCSVIKKREQKKKSYRRRTLHNFVVTKKNDNKNTYW